MNESTAGADASVEALKLHHMKLANLSFNTVAYLLCMLALVACIVQKTGNDRP